MSQRCTVPFTNLLNTTGEILSIINQLMKVDIDVCNCKKCLLKQINCNEFMLDRINSIRQPPILLHN
jgi:hypothetical protein